MTIISFLYIYGQLHHGFYKKIRNKYFKYSQTGHLQKDYPSKVAFGANKVLIATLSAPSPKGDSSSTGIVRNYLYALTTH